jgi:hypothetical protein
MRVYFSEKAMTRPVLDVPFNSGRIWEFFFQLEYDDKMFTKSFNAGNGDMHLAHNKVRFYFPYSDLTVPHPDAFALGILKVISPFVGSTIEVPLGVSQQFANDVKSHYKFDIQPVDQTLSPRDVTGDRYAVSFSGGADSVAAALIMPHETHLVLHSRCLHPEVPIREEWYKTEANIQTLRAMPEHFIKTVVYSDFERICWNGKFHLYPDSYAFTIPIIFLSDYFNFSGVVTGDIRGAITGDEVKFKKNFASYSNRMFGAVNLDFFPVLGGVSEFGSTTINRKYGLQDIATSCSYGAFKKPCMRCIKCFRKTMIDFAIDGKQVPTNILQGFKEGQPVQRYLYGTERRNIALLPTYKQVLKMIPGEKVGVLADLKQKTDLIDMDTAFELAVYTKIFGNEISQFKKECLDRLYQIIPGMNAQMCQEFENLDILSFFREKKNMEKLSRITP